MAIRGRNASGLLNQKMSAEIAGNAGDVPAVVAALRTSIFVKEVGATITTGGEGDNATTSGKVHPSIWYRSPGQAAPGALLASISGTNVASDSEIVAGAAVGSEYTTRDGTLKFATAYANASDRVFPKGTKFWAQNTSMSGGSANDKFIVYAQVEEFGAPPA